ncbi:hypothetical protein B0H63DRAFT_491957 [Podospora didyma]|uniref:RNB domain-containing protein n=1 Tax=Podospora didyma TaxID=330526 RepID=A0AAE0P7L7_9PEZI|nr:hypothetical protein B0H63DRAFT_491957 [Podospora didyma]
MLRSRSQQAYVCWRCLGPSSRKALLPMPMPVPAVLPRRVRSAPTPNMSLAACNWYSASRESSTRQALRLWNAENPPPYKIALEEYASKNAAHILNAGVQSADDLLLELEQSRDASRGPQIYGRDFVDLSSEFNTLQAGDLFEIRSTIWGKSFMAICLGTFNGFDHYYTDGGRWFASKNVDTRFVVRGFISDPVMLKPLIHALPSTSGDPEIMNLLNRTKAGPLRSIGAPLIRKIAAFQLAARQYRQTYGAELATAISKLPADDALLTLSEIAHRLIPSYTKRGKANYPDEILYAVHTALQSDDLRFSPVGQGGRNHVSYLFNVRSPSSRVIYDNVEIMVRNFYEFKPKISPIPQQDNEVVRSNAALFQKFVSEAQEAIDANRSIRTWSPHGMIGINEQKSAVPPSTEFSEPSFRIIKFIEMWAASDAFPRGSPGHALGAAVLRAIDRYEDAPFLDTTTGWTFLQEIGWVTPWDVQSRHSLRLPGIELDRRGGLVVPKDPKPVELAPDLLAPLRQDFAESTIYCIDAESATDIDDGVSIESAGDGEHWIHVHVADPASRIRPSTELADRAARLSQTTYLPGHHERMFSDDVIRDTFSLAPNRPSLVFSTRVSESGDVTGYKITPAVIRNVVYITPENVSAICGEADKLTQVPLDSFEVGTPPMQRTPLNRKMAKAEELSEQQLAELQTLSRLSKVLQQTRLKNGAMPVYMPRPRVEVSLEHVEVETAANGFLSCRGDPYIRISYQDSMGSDMVSSLMQTAGQVAARWCFDRDIPIPYRIQPLAKQNHDALRELTQTVLYPQLLEGKHPPMDQVRTLNMLCGGHDISTSPSIHFTMGMDMYTKATSPLRRYCDLLVHWQIEAALLEEHRRESSLASEKEEVEMATATPPYSLFTKSELENSFPQLRVRERHSKMLDNVNGNTEYILQALVRAWRFGENSEKLPSTFRFTVSEVARKAASGRLNWFGQFAQLSQSHLDCLGTIGDVNVGDVFEVELVDVIVPSRTIFVRALKKIDPRDEVGGGDLN